VQAKACSCHDIKLQGAPIALRMAKAAIDAGLDVDSASGLRMEHAYYAQVLMAICCSYRFSLALRLPGKWPQQHGVAAAGDPYGGQNGGAARVCREATARVQGPMIVPCTGPAFLSDS